MPRRNPETGPLPRAKGRSVGTLGCRAPRRGVRTATAPLRGASDQTDEKGRGERGPTRGVQGIEGGLHVGRRRRVPRGMGGVRGLRKGVVGGGV